MKELIKAIVDIRNDDKEQLAINKTEVVARNDAVVHACDTKIKAYDKSYVIAEDASEVQLFNNAYSEAYDTSIVIANDTSKVEAYNNSKVLAYGNTEVITHDNSTVYAHECCTINAFAESTVYKMSNDVTINIYGDAVTIIENVVLKNEEIQCKEIRGNNKYDAHNKELIKAFDKADVNVYNDVTVYAYNESKITAYNNSIVYAHDDSFVIVDDNATVYAYDDSFICKRSKTATVIVENGDVRVVTQY